jgi:hypothetical protein
MFTQSQMAQDPLSGSYSALTYTYTDAACTMVSTAEKPKIEFTVKDGDCMEQSPGQFYVKIMKVKMGSTTPPDFTVSGVKLK